MHSCSISMISDMELVCVLSESLIWKTGVCTELSLCLSVR